MAGSRWHEAPHVLMPTLRASKGSAPICPAGTRAHRQSRESREVPMSVLAQQAPAPVPRAGGTAGPAPAPAAHRHFPSGCEKLSLNNYAFPQMRKEHAQPLGTTQLKKRHWETTPCLHAAGAQAAPSPHTERDPARSWSMQWPSACHTSSSRALSPRLYQNPLCLSTAERPSRREPSARLAGHVVGLKQPG